MGGFVRVVKTERRRLDRAQMAYIEYIGNSIEIYEDENRMKAKEEKEIPSFWEWEMKILEQEKEYYENEILRLKGEKPAKIAIEDGNVDMEVDEEIVIDIKAGEELKESSQEIRKEEVNL